MSVSADPVQRLGAMINLYRAREDAYELQAEGEPRLEERQQCQRLAAEMRFIGDELFGLVEDVAAP
jgi:hypothetical protein